MRNLRAAVTMKNPPANAGYDCDHTGYHQCGAYPGVPRQGDPNEIICADEVIGRYVYLYLAATNYVQLCEVEVYGFRMYFL